jgi:hypothetical protein
VASLNFLGYPSRQRRHPLPRRKPVKILVEGKQRDTLVGHADLSNFLDVSAINQLTSQLQSAP